MGGVGDGLGHGGSASPSSVFRPSEVEKRCHASGRVVKVQVRMHFLWWGRCRNHQGEGRGSNPVFRSKIQGLS